MRLQLNFLTYLVTIVDWLVRIFILCKDLGEMLEDGQNTSIVPLYKGK